MSLETTGLIVFAHGSSVEPANAAVREVAERMAASGGFRLVEAAFLEMAKPDLSAAAACLAARGATKLVVIPYFLTMGIHLKRDLPLLVEKARAEVGVAISVTPPLDGHPALEAILLERAKEAIG